MAKGIGHREEGIGHRAEGIGYGAGSIGQFDLEICLAQEIRSG